LDTSSDQTGTDWLCEARRYYFNIVGKYGTPVQNLLKKVSTLNIHTIAPLHGPILHAPLDLYLEKYDLWSRYLPETEGVFIAYTSFHGNTASAALLLKNYLQDMGCSCVETADLARDDISEAIENAFRYSKLVLAAPSYDGGIMPFMEDFLHHLKAKNFQNRQVVIIENGSWAPSAGKAITDILSTMKDITFLSPTITLRGALMPSDNEHFKTLAALLLSSVQ
ncbi:MAG: FprA family A-type flavoprotein, partial [Lachnospiraceae bacterium]|nr:FprA family A-type flavoprotein [Lachnospiraceae bacterium]